MKFRSRVLMFVTGMIATLGLGLILLSSDGMVLMPKLRYDRLVAMEETYEKVEELKSDILDKFYLEVDEAALNEGMIRGMFEATGDKYTRYMNAEEFKEYNESTSGNYVGIGILSDVSENEIHVTRVFPGSPAERAGILSGDYVIEVDGEHIDDVGSDRLIDIMLGEQGTDIQVVIVRDDEVITYQMQRDRVEIPFVTSTHYDNIGYVYIYQFGTDTAEEFKSHVSELEKKGVEGLIVDLRDNPGGLVIESTEIADEFMGKGIIIYTLDKDGKRREYKSDRGKLDLPVVFLANEDSASSSEILLGAIKDAGVGEIVGVETFGKGIVQGVSSLKDGSGYKITISQYFTPSGQAIHKKGVTPDYIVEYEGIIDGEAPDFQNDLQLIKALEVLKENMLSN